ncbi:Hypothetical predicted protein, partial [Mytilus galloprovincialis]
ENTRQQKHTDDVQQQKKDSDKQQQQHVHNENGVPRRRYLQKRSKTAFCDSYSYFWHYLFNDSAAETHTAKEKDFDFYSDSEIDDELY